MATHVLTDASVTVNSVDLSDHVQQVQITSSVETQDDTAMGNSARSNSAGLFADEITVTFLQDFAASEVDATLWALYRAKTEHNVVVVPTSSSVGSTNPSFTLTGFISSYPPLGGQVGAQHVAEVTWVNSGADGLARATS